MSDRLFGTLQTPLKTIHYNGLETETVKVTVDPQNRTISADIQAAVMDTINNNVKKLKEAQIRLNELTTEIDDVEKLIEEIKEELSSDISKLQTSTSSLVNRVNNLEETVEENRQQVGQDIENALNNITVIRADMSNIFPN